MEAVLFYEAGLLALAFLYFLGGEEGAGFGGHLDGCSGKELFDGDDLEARVGFAPEVGFVVAGAGGFGDHVFGGGFEGDEDADFGLFALEDANQVADVAGFDVTGFDLDDDALEGLFGVVYVVDDAIYALIFAFFTYPLLPSLKGGG